MAAQGGRNLGLGGVTGGAVMLTILRMIACLAAAGVLIVLGPKAGHPGGFWRQGTAGNNFLLQLQSPGGRVTGHVGWWSATGKEPTSLSVPSTSFGPRAGFCRTSASTLIMAARISAFFSFPRIRTIARWNLRSHIHPAPDANILQRLSVSLDSPVQSDQKVGLFSGLVQ